MRMHISHVWVVLTGLAACADHGSQLDGPVDYHIDNGFIRTVTDVHFELSGEATKRVTVGTGPTTMTTGTVDAGALDALRGHVSAVEVEGYRDQYSCADFQCTTDLPVITAILSIDGTHKQIRVDRGIEDRDLPAGLAPILTDLDTIARHLP